CGGRNQSKRESAVLPKRPTGSGKVKNPACGLVDNTARLRILTSSQFPPRPDIITDLLRADIFKNLQHPPKVDRGWSLTRQEVDPESIGREAAHERCSRASPEVAILPPPQNL